jgi:hypothetical protein
MIEVCPLSCEAESIAAPVALNKEKNMNVKLPLGILLMVAAILGYLLGTESGRQRRDSLVRMAGREDATDELTDETIEAVTGDAAIDAVDDAVTGEAATEAATTGD